MPPRDDRAVSLMVAGIEARTSPRITAPLGEIATERLHLTHVVAEDADGLAAVFADRAVWEFPYGRGMGREWTGRFVRAAVTHWESFGFGLWVVKTLRDHVVIGYLGLSMPAFLSELVPAERMPAVEIGWRLHPEHWGQGYAAEGAHAALQEATLELSEVCSAPQSLNPRWARVAQRIGMENERTATLAATDARGAVDVDLYWITRRQRTAQH